MNKLPDFFMERQNEISRDILKFDGVASVTIIDTLMKTVSNMLNTMNYVVVILIVASALLAFVVLYNLANVNISERIRELATIKVLGFYDREVYNYVGRETTILTGIGMFFGILIGKALTVFILKTCELDQIMFGTTIKIQSYIYSLLLTVVFTLLVNITTYFALKKVDMIESLKSIE